jgi:hypothetical protein
MKKKKYHDIFDALLLKEGRIAVSMAASHSKRNITQLELPQITEFLTACQE